MLAKLVLLGCIGAALAQESRVVQVEQGSLRGYKDPQGDFYSFYDVPYATAPTGKDKFKAPLPATSWTGTFDAVNRMVACPQFLPIPTQEDCLVASIFVPNTNETNLPVVVNVHGGVYLMAAGYFFPLSNLADRTQKAIVVIFNYRLSMHGFLCLGTEGAPGNAGMKDQVALLRWVNKNIASFGGNPDDVTISGCSAGGGSVDFLTLSPMTRGLFNKAIIDSGAVLGITGPQDDPMENAKRYARHLNFTDVDNISALEEFYTSASFELLLSGSELIASDNYGSSVYFAPCVERDTGTEMFLPDTPVNIINKGNYPKIPLMYGFSEMEGLIRINDFNMLKDMMNENFTVFVPDELQFADESQNEFNAAQIKEFYFRSKNVSEETVLSYVDYFTDVLFAYAALRVANLRRESLDDTIYLYQYSFVDKNTPLIPHTNIRGPDHCSQFFAVTDQDVTNATDEYKAMKETMRQMWMDFIVTGNPTPPGSSLPTWPPMSGYLLPFMVLNETSRIEHSPLLFSRALFWDSLYKVLYRQPIPPSSAATSSISIMLLATSLLITYIKTF